jgi:hypothetical protein
VASAAGSTSGSLLLQYLTLTGWHVDVRVADDGYFATAERDDARIAASAKTRASLALLLFEHACGSPLRG